MFSMYWEHTYCMLTNTEKNKAPGRPSFAVNFIRFQPEKI